MAETEEQNLLFVRSRNILRLLTIIEEHGFDHTAFLQQHALDWNQLLADGESSIPLNTHLAVVTDNS